MMPHQGQVGVATGKNPKEQAEHKKGVINLSKTFTLSSRKKSLLVRALA
jgi:hypothetical protein